MDILYFVVFIELFVYLIYKKSSLILSKNDLFPFISKDLINKFNSFDYELGWVNQRNTVKKELSQGKNVTYVYNKFGARSIGSLDSKNSSISTYGDSYCLAREVGGDKTWQYHLSKVLGTNVMNFGVGNYGLDQSLLRLKKEYKNHPTETVVMAITPYTVTRITSVWKHFSEFENVLAVKPRFIIDKNRLTLIPNIIRTKDELANMRKNKDLLHRYDEHIDYFNEHIYKFPFTLSFFGNPKILLRPIYAKFSSIFNKLNCTESALYFSDKYFLSEIKYRKSLFKKNSKLLKLLIEDYVNFSIKNKFKPVLLMLPALEDVRYYNKTNDKYYCNFIASINDNILVYDFMDFLSREKDNTAKYYVDPYFGGHYSILGNLELATFLKNELGNEH